jgi:hypothetical protein
LYTTQLATGRMKRRRQGEEESQPTAKQPLIEEEEERTGDHEANPNVRRQYSGRFHYEGILGKKGELIIDIDIDLSGRATWVGWGVGRAQRSAGHLSCHCVQGTSMRITASARVSPSARRRQVASVEGSRQARGHRSRF